MRVDKLPSPGRLTGSNRLRTELVKAISYCEVAHAYAKSKTPEQVISLLHCLRTACEHLETLVLDDAKEVKDEAQETLDEIEVSLDDTEDTDEVDDSDSSTEDENENSDESIQDESEGKTTKSNRKKRGSK